MQGSSESGAWRLIEFGTPPFIGPSIRRTVSAKAPDQH
jgi:hypothetical protein